MANMTIYVPDELAERMRGAGVSISPIAQEAFRRFLGEPDSTAIKHPITPAIEGWVAVSPGNVRCEVAAWDADGRPLVASGSRLVVPPGDQWRVEFHVPMRPGCGCV